MPTVHLLIKGKVQGVFYRARAKETADKLKVTGWVKNISHGHVEAVATGSDEQIQQFVEWCKEGSPKAKVTEVIIKKQPEVSYTSFTIK